jgi:hypothetical protein
MRYLLCYSFEFILAEDIGNLRFEAAATGPKDKEKDS